MTEITLEGIRSQVFGGYNCLRGYASISDLIKISEVKSYQRDVNSKHLEEISEFYNKGEYLFFPEIILGCEIEESLFLDNMQNSYPTTLYSEGIKYRYYKSNGKSELKVDSNKIKLHIIDGNHRLKAFDGVTFNSQNKVPFCILFLQKGINDKDANVIFNNINYKQVPLGLEENLKRIFYKRTRNIL